MMYGGSIKTEEGGHRRAMSGEGRSPPYPDHPALAPTYSVEATQCVMPPPEQAPTAQPSLTCRQLHRSGSHECQHPHCGSRQHT